MDVMPKLKINVGGRVDDYKRRVDRVGGLPFTPQAIDQTAFSYRAGFVYEPAQEQQFYVSTATSFTPVTTIPEDGSQLDPSTARNFEVGHRWQGWNGRVATNVAFYYTVKNNLSIRESATTTSQVGEQTARGLDVDLNTDLGGQTHLIFNYGFARPRFDDAEELTGLQPRFVPENNVNLWLRKDWVIGLNAAFGARYLGSQFVNDSNTTEIEGYTIFSAAVGYRADRWEWSLNAENLFDKDDYFLPGHFSNLVFPGPPMSVTSTIRLKFN
jgi:iron complex outermembrane receptor protein